MTDKKQPVSSEITLSTSPGDVSPTPIVSPLVTELKKRNARPLDKRQLSEILYRFKGDQTSGGYAGDFHSIPLGVFDGYDRVKQLLADANAYLQQNPKQAIRLPAEGVSMGIKPGEISSIMLITLDKAQYNALKEFIDYRTRELDAAQRSHSANPPRR